jgi:hypothetical protein
MQTSMTVESGIQQIRSSQGKPVEAIIGQTRANFVRKEKPDLVRPKHNSRGSQLAAASKDHQMIRLFCKSGRRRGKRVKERGQVAVVKRTAVITTKDGPHGEEEKEAEGTFIDRPY